MSTQSLFGPLVVGPRVDRKRFEERVIEVVRV
jgi:hypothetical protein